MIATALGGELVTTTVEGRERYGVTVRYPRDLRDNPQAIASNVLVGTGAAMVPLGQLAAIRVTQGPPSIRTENAELVAYLYVDMHGRDIGGFVADAARAVRDQIKLPPGYRIQWSGQYEYLERAAARLRIVVPATLLLIFLLLYLNFGRHRRDADRDAVGAVRAGGRRLADLVARVQSQRGGRGRLHRARRRCRGNRRRHADLSRPGVTRRGAQRTAEGRPVMRADLDQAIIKGAAERVRPKMMTVIAIMAGLLPILWSSGTGSELMRRIAVPMVGGMVSSTVLTLLVIPALYALIKGWPLRRTVTTGPDVRRAPKTAE